MPALTSWSSGSRKSKEGLTIHPSHQNAPVSRRIAACLSAGSTQTMLQVLSPFSAAGEFDAKAPRLTAVDEPQSRKLSTSRDLMLPLLNQGATGKAQLQKFCETCLQEFDDEKVDRVELDEAFFKHFDQL